MKKVFILIFLLLSSLAFAQLPDALQGRYKFVFPMGDDFYKVCNGKYWGVVNAENELVISIEFQQVGNFSDNLIAVRKDNRWGYLDRDDKVVIDFMYQEADEFEDGIARVRADWKYGYINKENKVVIPMIYDLLSRPGEGIITYKKGLEFGILNTEGKRLTSKEYFPKGLRRIYLKGYYGFVNTKGQAIIPLQYKKLEHLVKDFYSFLLNGKEGILNPYTLKILVPNDKYDEILGYKDGFFYVVRDGKYGLIDDVGKVVIEPKDYDSICYFRGRIATVRSGENYGVINRAGDLIVPVRYKEISVMDDGYIRASNEGDYFPIGRGTNVYFSHKFIADTLSDMCVVVSDGMSKILSAKTGKLLTKKSYDYVDTTLYRNSLISITDNKTPKHYGMLDIRTGKEIVPIKFESLTRTLFDDIFIIMEDGKKGIIYIDKASYHYIVKPQYQKLILVKVAPNLLRISTEEGYGLISEDGKFLLPMKYDKITPFNRIGLKVELNKKFGAVNAEGKIYVPVEYISLSSYDNSGYLIAKKVDKFGVLDNTGRVAVPFSYDKILPLYNDVGICMLNGGYGFLGPKGKIRIPTDYQSVVGLSGDFVQVQFAYKFGIMTKKGKLLIKPSLDAIIDRNDGFFALSKDGKLGLMNSAGKVITPFIYKSIGSFAEGYAIVKNEGRCGFIDESGRVRIPIIYNGAVNFKDGTTFVVLNGQQLKINKKGEILPYVY